VEQKKPANLPVDAVKAFLAGQAAAVAREQRSSWITPWEVAARLPPTAVGAEAIEPTNVEAALRVLAVPCVKIGGTRRYLLALAQPGDACLTPECFRPTDVAAGLKRSLAMEGR
jgi:hypothetical protein